MVQVIQTYNQLFWNFVNNYDINDSNILRKIIHSFSVAEKCFAISCQQRLTENERNFSYLLGLFHDLGRFEQWKLYKTYNDKTSVDHGELSKEIIQSFSCKELLISEKQKQLLIEAIRYHTKSYKGTDKEILFYNDIIKNADAYCNVVTTANGSQQMTANNDGVTKEILSNFLEMKPLWEYNHTTKLDRALKLTACCYYVKFNFLRQEILNNNYIDMMYNTFSKYLNDEDKKIYEFAVKTVKEKY